MRKFITLIFMLIFLVIGAYSLFDIFRSIGYVFFYETMNTRSLGVISGKFLFFVVGAAGYFLSLKTYRKLKA